MLVVEVASEVVGVEEAPRVAAAEVSVVVVAVEEHLLDFLPQPLEPSTS